MSNTKDALLVDVSLSLLACEPIERDEPERVAEALDHAQKLIVEFSIPQNEHPIHCAARWLIQTERYVWLE